METRKIRSLAIAKVIVAQPIFSFAQTVAVFDPLPVEPDISSLWEQGVERFCFPRLLGDTMEFVRVSTLDHLTAAAWHSTIREPSAIGNIVVPAEIDLVLVPGVAFTRTGERMGRGGGYYDRYLAQLPANAVKLGVGFAIQLVEELPVEAHDIALDGIITEEGLIERSSYKTAL